MKPSLLTFSTVSAIALAAALTACNKSVTEPDPVTAAPSDTVKNLFANKSAPLVDTVKDFRADTLTAAIKPYAYFDLDSNKALAATSDTAAWDLAIRTTGIRVNGQFQLVTANFDSLTLAPETGYAATGSPAWYDYNSTTFTITPKAGTVLVIKTASGKYAKIQVLSYYKNNPAVPAGLTDTARYFTFRYFLQNDGSRNLDAKAKRFTYFSMHTKAEVNDTTLGWDLALSTTTIMVNGQSQLASGVDFDTLFTAPTSGYGAGSTPYTWYDYNPDTHLISPKLATVLIVKTADNKYGKVQLLSYYKDFPAVPNGDTDTPRYYAFRYFLQTNGTSKLK